MRAWLLPLAVLATFNAVIQVAGTEEHKSVIDEINISDSDSIKKRKDIYSDNSIDNNFKTNYDKPKPDPNTLVQVESSLLSLFGLRAPPKIDRSKVVVPENMKLLYAQMTGQPYSAITQAHPKLHSYASNTIRTFMHRDSTVDDRFLEHHKFRLYFNVESIPIHEKLRAAEIMVSRDAIPIRSADRKRYQVLVYDIIRVGIKGKRSPDLQLIDSKSVWLNGSDSVILDVKPAVEKWLLSPEDNHGLLIDVRTPRRLKPAKFNHVRLRRSIQETEEQWAQKQPMLYTYTDDERHLSRSTRDVNRSKRAHRRAHRRKDGREICQRRPLYVDFSDVGWSDWIVAPPGYDAFYCNGDCPFPLADHLNSTNHAVVQTLVNNINPASVPKACCVPTQLTAISMLYLNDQNTVVLKNYQDMAVVGCGCR